MKNPQENLVRDATASERSNKGFGVEIVNSEAKKIADELSKINDLISHDEAIKIEDIESLDTLAGGIIIDIGGEMMTAEEVRKIPDLKETMEIWKEMSEGNFENTWKLKRITPKVSKYIESLKQINLDRLVSTEGLVLPTSIEGGLSLKSLVSAEGLVLPQSVGGSLDLKRIISPKGLVLPSEIGADIVLISLTSAEGIVFPNHIKGSLALDQVATTKGLVLPKEIDGSLWLNSLTSAEGLNLPDRVSQLIHLEGLPEQELNKIKARYPNYTYKIRT